MVVNLARQIMNEIWPMLVVFIVAISLIRFFYLQNHRERFCLHKELSYLLTKSELNSTSGINLAPFSEILRYEFGTKMFNYNVFGNIIIFIPFGYLIGAYVSPKKVWPVLITTFVTSIAVEFVQLHIGRSFDVDDIILNVIGGILGYLLYIGLSAINRHLPDFFKSDLFYNILYIIIIALLIIYFLGYWGVIFR